MEPWKKAGPKDWQNMFAITRFRYINEFFSNVLLLTGAKKKIARYTNDFADIKVRYTEVPL